MSKWRQNTRRLQWFIKNRNVMKIHVHSLIYLGKYVHDCSMHFSVVIPGAIIIAYSFYAVAEFLPMEVFL